MSFSGYTSSFNSTSSSDDILSKAILSTGGTNGQYAHVILGGLLVQFGTGQNSTGTGGTTITLPVTYDAGTGNNTGWHSPYIVFALPFNSEAMYIGQRNGGNFTAYISNGSTTFHWITIGPVPTGYSNSSSSFSGYKSNFTDSTSTNDIISDVILSTATGGGSPQGQYGRIKLGGLLVQFGTGYNVGNGTVTFPVAFPTNSNWNQPCIVLAIAYSDDICLGISSRTTTTFSITGMGSSNIWYNWIAIGPSS
jgi:hypothetical protein